MEQISQWLIALLPGSAHQSARGFRASRLSDPHLGDFYQIFRLVRIWNLYAGAALGGVEGQPMANEPTEIVPEGLGGAQARAGIVLLVEDDLFIRMDVGDQLREAGWTVYEAGTADEAVELLQTPMLIDLVLTDIEMPGKLDGLGLADYIVARGRRSKWRRCPGATPQPMRISIFSTASSRNPLSCWPPIYRL
ncbi:response regulator [Mesorhizobium sp. M0587]|uniref:response regulator n=1 Tax=Mesorhizobium sp. M0587 TaxID=2956964 RepID=UPI0033374FD6